MTTGAHEGARRLTAEQSAVLRLETRYDELIVMVREVAAQLDAIDRGWGLTLDGDDVAAKYAWRTSVLRCAQGTWFR